MISHSTSWAVLISVQGVGVLLGCRFWNTVFMWPLPVCVCVCVCVWRGGGGRRCLLTVSADRLSFLIAFNHVQITEQPTTIICKNFIIWGSAGMVKLLSGLLVGSWRIFCVALGRAEGKVSIGNIQRPFLSLNCVSGRTSLVVLSIMSAFFHKNEYRNCFWQIGIWIRGLLLINLYFHPLLRACANYFSY